MLATMWQPAALALLAARDETRQGYCHPLWSSCTPKDKVGVQKPLNIKTKRTGMFSLSDPLNKANGIERCAVDRTYKHRQCTCIVMRTT